MVRLIFKKISLVLAAVSFGDCKGQSGKLGDSWEATSVFQTREWWFHRGAMLQCDQILDLLRRSS